MLSAKATRSSAFSGKSPLQIGKQSNAAPYRLAKGITCVIDSSSPFTELMRARPG